MRMLPDRYASPKPATIKRNPSQVAHVSAPLKGLNMSSKLTQGDPLTAPILTNFVVDDDRITCRAGYRKIATHTDLMPIETLIPWYGQPERLGGATNGKLINAMTGEVLVASIREFEGGFSSNDWSWTSFANLGQQKFTVMCNGTDGVWSWDGGIVPAGAVVPVTAMTKANPAVATVGVAAIGGFTNGGNVLIAGGTGDWAGINGTRVIANINAGAGTFELPGLDTSTYTGTMNAGVTAHPLGSMVKENITAPGAEPWIDPDHFNIVLSHMNRLWFADDTNLAVYYLPLQQKSGEVKVLPLNALFKHGGLIRALYTWTLEGGTGINDQLVIFSSNGECVIYAGTDPDTDFQLVGIFRFDSPMSKHAVANYGGELWVLISTGLVPMSTLLRAESEHLGQIDKPVISLFLGEAIKYGDRPGWSAMINPSSNRLICNVPQGASNRYTQMVRHMPRPVWSQWEAIPSRCWGWIDPYVYFGDDSGSVYQMHPSFLNDAGNPIRVDVQMAWSQFKTPALKHFKMVKTYTITDGRLRPFVDVKTDYDLTPVENQPEVSFAEPGAVWDEATWDEDYWAAGPQPISMWNGIGALGRVGGPRLTALILNCEFSITGWDVIYEPGSAV